MKTIQLLPYSYKLWGWFILVPSIIVGLVCLFSGDISYNVSLPVLYNSGFMDESGFFAKTYVDVVANGVGLLIIIGAVLVGFSQEKEEDEYLQQLRLRAVFWSLLISYTIFFVLMLTVYGILFFNLMILLLYLPILLYILLFNYYLHYEK